MSENSKAYRLARVASEINVGIEVVLEHLKKKNIEIERSPNAKVSEEIRQLLLRDFKSDLALKERAETIHLRTNRIDVEIHEEETKVASKEEVPSVVQPKEKLPKITDTNIQKSTEDAVEDKISITTTAEKEPVLTSPEKEAPINTADVVEDKTDKKTIEGVANEQEKSAETKLPDLPQTESPTPEIEPVKEKKAEVSVEIQPVAEVKELPIIQEKSSLQKPITEKKEEEQALPQIEEKNDADLITDPNKEVAKTEKTKIQHTKVKHEQKQPEAKKVVLLPTKEPTTDDQKNIKQEIAAPEITDKEVPKEENKITHKEAPADVTLPLTEEPPKSKVTLTGPKVVGKIDLDNLNPKTRPDKKTLKIAKKDPPRQEKKNPEVKPTENKTQPDASVKTADKGDAAAAGKRKRKRIVKKPGDIKGQKTDVVPTLKKDKDAGATGTTERPKSKLVLKKNIGEAEVSEKEIQDKIKATMAKLNSATSNPTSNKLRKLRKQKRETAALEKEAAELEESKVLHVTEFITANELAKLMNVPVTKIITTCFSLGLVVSINMRLDAEVIELLAEEFGFIADFVGVTEDDAVEAEQEDGPEDLEARPPIVTIMGHVDHGKTSLLDYIRTTNVVAGEAGGITQHIGAYEVTTKDGKQITFLDTPGHEAFTAMRARGAKVTDIAVIVVAADDYVMTQTKEAISHAQAAGVPMIFAINKIDKPDANPEKIKEQLAQMNLLVEDWGGKYLCQEISAKKGINIDKLLEKILFEAEMLDLKANPNRNAIGAVIESSLDKGRGYVSTILVQNGTLRVGDIILAGQYYGKVRAMSNERGGKVIEAPPSTPVMVLGINGAPQAGDKLKVYDSEQEAKEIANKRQQLYREQVQRTTKHITLEEIGRRLALGNFKELNLIVKGDVDGSVEALCGSLQRLSNDEIHVRIIHRGVGAITESDVLLASASDAIIIGFQVRPTPNARKQAENEDIDIRLYSIIYAAINEIQSAIEGMMAPTTEERFVCNIDVREVFKITKVGTIAGCLVTVGKVSRDTKVRVIRDNIVIHTGEISSLKRFKDDVKEVIAGMECGISIKNYSDIKVGDTIEGFEEIQVKRTSS